MLMWRFSNELITRRKLRCFFVHFSVINVSFNYKNSFEIDNKLLKRYIYNEDIRQCLCYYIQ